MKNKFSTNRANFFDLKILIPVIHKDTDISTEIKPKDWKNKSDIKLPLNPKRLLIFVLSGKIKLGSSGE